MAPHRLLKHNLAARVFKPAAKRAGVGRPSWYTLRHTCVTELLRRGLNAKQVQVWLGHHSPAFTMATHVHLLSDDRPESPFGAQGGNACVNATHGDARRSRHRRSGRSRLSESDLADVTQTTATVAGQS